MATTMVRGDAANGFRKKPQVAGARNARCLPARRHTTGRASGTTEGCCLLARSLQGGHRERVAKGASGARLRQPCSVPFSRPRTRKKTIPTAASTSAATRSLDHALLVACSEVQAHKAWSSPHEDEQEPPRTIAVHAVALPGRPRRDGLMPMMS
ncbi:hypothetical protein HPB50_014089 [Hyalomma asiaticum]|uniref:Uncharacterized protein n=1 Tax=Hyalomma asiaticum TaxID=266040 RepID=A0ACB7S790_HYAAI|nr:hypothetical protein HPB50_014089 [Hyalomma asiaticum]